MAHGDDIVRHNDTMPVFRSGTPFWQRVLCVLGYHKREVRRAAPDHRGGGGIWLGGMRLRDQCGRCDALLNEQMPTELANKLAPRPPRPEGV